MPYHQYIFTISEQENRDIAIALLNGAIVEGFEEKGNELIAVTKEEIPKETLNELIDLLNVTYSRSIMEEVNWNAVWEAGFQPIKVVYPDRDKVFAYVRANFHDPLNDADYDLMITPKMSFGTGHHATTYGMISYMSSIQFENRVVVDFGTGTGLLAILAEKMGAKSVLAIDYDPWCITNATENISANECRNIKLKQSDHFEILTRPDIILANINLNIIKSNLPAIAESCSDDTVLLFSGLLLADETDILNALYEVNITESAIIKNDGWLIIAAKKGR